MGIRHWGATRRWLLILLVTAALRLASDSDRCKADEPPSSATRLSVKKQSEKPARRTVKLPGLLIDFQRRCVDLDGTICLEQGLLELIACRKGTKEHESIVSVSARPMHIHTALLLLGANNGHPAMRKPVDEKGKTRWVNLPPRGDSIDVLLVIKDKAGKPIERPISDFIVRASERVDEVDGDVITAPAQIKSPEDKSATDKSATDKRDARLPHAFLFAGSHLRDASSGPRQYLADLSGNVISIATFGDEVLCLPFHETQDDGGLMWRIKPNSLPIVRTKVILRLRPKLKAAKPFNAEPAGDGKSDTE